MTYFLAKEPEPAPVVDGEGAPKDKVEDVEADTKLEVNEEHVNEIVTMFAHSVTL